MTPPQGIDGGGELGAHGSAPPGQEVLTPKEQQLKAGEKAVAALRGSIVARIIEASDEYASWLAVQDTLSEAHARVNGKLGSLGSTGAITSNIRAAYRGAEMQAHTAQNRVRVAKVDLVELDGEGPCFHCGSTITWDSKEERWVHAVSSESRCDPAGKLRAKP